MKKKCVFTKAIYRGRYVNTEYHDAQAILGKIVAWRGVSISFSYKVKKNVTVETVLSEFFLN